MTGFGRTRFAFESRLSRIALSENRDTVESMAEEIFQIYRLIALARSRAPIDRGDISETEFLALDCLERQQPMTIGEVQKQIGVVPAQMSRIVRALETQGGRGLVACQINAEDRRRIDMTLTSNGKEAYDQFKNNRVKSIRTILDALDPSDRSHFIRILRQIRVAFEAVLEVEEPDASGGE